MPKEVRWPLCADLGGLARGDAQQLLVGCREDVVGVATRRPHLVVSRERDVDDGAQRLRMTNGGDATFGFGNPLALELNFQLLGNLLATI